MVEVAPSDAGIADTQAGSAPRLKALTLEARTAIHGYAIELTHLPFRVGREDRGPDAPTLPPGPEQERRGTEPTRTNDLYLWEPTTERYVSREHFQIEREGDRFFLVDRNSALGTWVEGRLVGGHREGGRIPLFNGDVLIIGSHHSGMIFKFVVPNPKPVNDPLSDTPSLRSVPSGVTSFRGS